MVLASAPAHAWSEAGHRIIASIAFRKLTDAQRLKFVALIEAHPRFAEDFERELTREPTLLSERERTEWLLQQASIWPDMVRNFKGDAKSTYHHATWHYINLPQFLEPSDEAFFRGKLTNNISFHAPATIVEDMNIVQVIKKSREMLVDPKVQASEKAILLAWLCHTVGDIHQPLHSTALFSETNFAKGDRGGNSVKTKQRGNLHSLWDQFPGGDIKWRTAHNRALELINELQPNEAMALLEEEDWLAESFKLAQEVVYAPEIRDHLKTTLTDREPIICSEEYLKHSGAIAQQRIQYAGHRLGLVLTQILD